MGKRRVSGCEQWPVGCVGRRARNQRLIGRRGRDAFRLCLVLTLVGSPLFTSHAEHASDRNRDVDWQLQVQPDALYLQPGATAILTVTVTRVGPGSDRVVLRPFDGPINDLPVSLESTYDEDCGISLSVADPQSWYYQSISFRGSFREDQPKTCRVGLKAAGDISETSFVSQWTLSQGHGHLGDLEPSNDSIPVRVIFRPVALPVDTPWWLLSMIILLALGARRRLAQRSAERRTTS